MITQPKTWIAGLLLVPFASLAHASAHVSWEQIEAIVRQNPGLTTVDEFVAALPEALRDQPTLLYRSRGLAKDVTSFEFPRVVLPAERLLLSYSACDLDPHRDALYAPCEAVEALYQGDDGRVSAGIIHFAGKGQSGPAWISKPDAIQDCKGCHGTDFRPLFEPHDSWVGTYGSLSNQTSDVMAEGSAEHKGYQSFVEHNFRLQGGLLQEPIGPARYTALGWKKELPLLPMQQTVSVVHGKSARPNADLNTVINTINLRRLMHRLVTETTYREGKRFEDMRFAIQWWGKCLGDLNPIFIYGWGFWPYIPELDSVFPARYAQELTGYRKMLDERAAQVKRDYRAHLDEVFKDNFLSPGMTLISEKSIVYYNTYVPHLMRLFELMGLSVELMSTSFYSWGNSLGNDRGKEFQPLNHATPDTMRSGVAMMRDVINAHFEATDPALARMSCVELKAASLDSLH